MRLTLLLLLLANLVLFAWQRGAFGTALGERGEPQRLDLQIAPERIRLLTPEQLAALRNAATSPGEGAANPACIELGDFDAAGLARIEARLAALALGDRLHSRRVEGPGWFAVILPALGTRTEAERTAQDLRNRGIRDLVVMSENSAMPNAILLGSFKDRELALRHQADLARRGLKGAQMVERPAGAEATRFEISGVDAALLRELAEIRKEFPQSRLGACGN